jgi:hypothetical protein
VAGTRIRPEPKPPPPGTRIARQDHVKFDANPSNSAKAFDFTPSERTGAPPPAPRMSVVAPRQHSGVACNQHEVVNFTCSGRTHAALGISIPLNAAQVRPLN